MTASTALRQGQVVRYEGSKEAFRGGLFRIAFRYTCTCKELGFPSCDVCESGHAALYDLSRYAAGARFSERDEVVLYAARPQSVMHVPARQAAGA